MSIFCAETPPQRLLSPDPYLIKVGQGSLITRASCVLLVISLFLSLPLSLSYSLSRCRSNYRLCWKSLLLPPVRLRVWGGGREREASKHAARRRRGLDLAEHIKAGSAGFGRRLSGFFFFSSSSQRCNVLICLFIFHKGSNEWQSHRQVKLDHCRCSK